MCGLKSDALAALVMVKMTSLSLIIREGQVTSMTKPIVCGAMRHGRGKPMSRRSRIQGLAFGAALAALTSAPGLAATPKIVFVDTRLQTQSDPECERGRECDSR